MLLDRVEVLFKAGKGGDGIISFRRNKSGPDGGNGGRGGDIYIQASSDITLLNQFSREVEILAQDGAPGAGDRMTGKDGADLTVFLPVGTSVIDSRTNKLLYELSDLSDRFLICKGGNGGLGNWEFRSSTVTTPRVFEPGKKGEQFKVILSLKLIADFGLIGLPNSGKSSLLNELTNAKAKTANYSFTTLSPNLGVLGKKVLADIPGLIEGASEGRGLGISFLKHIEKVGMVLHCISVDSKDHIKDYETVRGEMMKFNPEILEKNELILVTKSDLVDKIDLKKVISKLKNKSTNILPVSIYDFESIESLKKLLIQNN
jgi:GTPase